ncbi:MAG: general secretion pathway protein D, partial [Gammaproteobacteria bacterium]
SFPVIANSKPMPFEKKEELLTINMRNADISVVIQWIAEQTGKKIVVDPRVKGNVTVLSNAPMTSNQAYNTFMAMLDVYGFAASESGGILRIFPAAMAKSSPAQLIQNFDTYGTTKGQILYVFQAENVEARSLEKLVKPLIPPSGHISTFADSNLILIADEMENVKRLVDLMKQLDSSGDLSIDIISLKYASAKNVVGLTQSILKTDKTLSFAITSDERSNSLLLSGDKRSKSTIKQLVRQLDRSVASGGNTRVVYLHYLDAAELLPILRGMSAAILKDSKDSKSNSSSVSIEASESTNALIMTAPPAILDVMADVISQVDIRRAQVLVEAIIVEVSQNFSQKLGVEWSSGFNQSNGVEAVTEFGLNKLASTITDVSILGPGLTLGFYRNGSLRALATAIANETEANILSTPSILTLDNQEAEVLVGSNIPLITGQSTTSSTTDNPFTTIERRDIGLSLKITPQINEGSSITLDILQEIETVVPSTQVINDIVTDKRSIKTKVIVENESILVLGGLISSDTQQLVSKVPFFGDLPLLGHLFKSTSDQVIKKNLMVFIYPVIVDSGQIADKVSRKKYNLLKELREKYTDGQLSIEGNTLNDYINIQPNKKAAQ